MSGKILLEMRAASIGRCFLTALIGSFSFVAYAMARSNKRIAPFTPSRNPSGLGVQQQLIEEEA